MGIFKITAFILCSVFSANIVIADSFAPECKSHKKTEKQICDVSKPQARKRVQKSRTKREKQKATQAFRDIVRMCEDATTRVDECLKSLEPSSKPECFDARGIMCPLFVGAPVCGTLPNGIRKSFPSLCEAQASCASDIRRIDNEEKSECEQSPSAALSGIKAQILVGPSCPVMRLDQPCPDKPYANRKVTILDASTQEIVKTVSTDSSGKFEVALPAGQYLVQVTTFIRPQTTEVEVGRDGWTEVTIQADSGIR